MGLPEGDRVLDGVPQFERATLDHGPPVAALGRLGPRLRARGDVEQDLLVSRAEPFGRWRGELGDVSAVPVAEQGGVDSAPPLFARQ